jgi:hypothetical protein
MGAFLVTDCTIWIVDSLLVGGSSTQYLMGPAEGGSSGLDVRRSALYFGRSQAIGGQGGVGFDASSGSYQNTYGGRGIYAEDSTLFLLGGPSSLVQGGDAGSYPLAGPRASGGTGLSMFGVSNALLSNSLPVASGRDSNGSARPGVYVGPNSTLNRTSRVYPTIGTNVPAIGPGGSFDLDLTGNPGSQELLFLSLSTMQPVLIPGFDGAFALDLGMLFHIATFQLNATGQASLNIPMQPAPNMIGLPLFLQAIEYGPPLAAFSNLHLVTIVP